MSATASDHATETGGGGGGEKSDYFQNKVSDGNSRNT